MKKKIEGNNKKTTWKMKRALKWLQSIDMWLWVFAMPVYWNTLDKTWIRDKAQRKHWRALIQNTNALFSRRLQMWHDFMWNIKIELYLEFCDEFNSIQVYLYSAFYDTIVAKQLYRKLSFYNIFIYCRKLIYLTYVKIW